MYFLKKSIGEEIMCKRFNLGIFFFSIYMLCVGCERIPNQSSTSQCKQQMVGYESGRIGSKMVKLRVDVRIHSINFNLSMANTMRILKQSNASRVEQLKNGRVRVGYANVEVFVHSLSIIRYSNAPFSYYILGQCISKDIAANLTLRTLHKNKSFAFLFHTQGPCSYLKAFNNL